MTDLLDAPVTETYPNREVPFEPTTKMKPSEALRLGRMMRPEHSAGTPLHGDKSACALGAIFVGYRPEAKPSDFHYDKVEKLAGLTANQGIEVFSTYDRALHLGFPGSFADGVIIEYLEDKGL